MPAGAQLALRRIYELDKDILAGFECGHGDLDVFLAQSAHDYSDHGLTETIVAFVGSDGAPAAFFSLSADGLPLRSSELLELGLPFECPITYFPAVKITKLAVREDMQSAGLGAELLKIIEGLAFNNSVAVRLLTVDAINDPRAIAFYQRHGFKPSLQNEIRQQRADRNRPNRRVAEQTPQSVLMYRDLYSPEDEVPPASLWPRAAAANQVLPNEGV
ncbi:GNAT family N-acetyltransferase [Paraburkholderia xenovorans]|uniref:GNAT family N-acetyltransferase n=1 Tax=Paraburkholderia xenovorans TaxID=36873 RepID=UPI0038B6D64D